jgi:arginase
MTIHIIAMPYDSGRRGERMGAGPLRLLDAGLAEAIENAGFDVIVDVVELPWGMWPSEVASAFALGREAGNLVANARQAGSLPLILSGNCMQAAFAAVQGIAGPVSVFWFDAHADFNTPDTTTSGFADGTALAALCGRCWHALAGDTRVLERDVVLIGGRDLDEGEEALLRASAVTRIAANEMPNGLRAVRERSWTPAYVHIDLDVLDPSVARINQFAAPNGVTTEQLQDAIGTIRELATVAAMSITAFDPAGDAEGTTSKIIVELVPKLIASAVPPDDET